MFRFANARNFISSNQRRTLFQAKRDVKFPPDGRFPLFCFALLSFSLLANDLMKYNHQKQRLNDLIRKTKAGESIFGPLEIARNLTELEKCVNDDAFSSATVVSLIPAGVDKLGMFESIQKGLESQDELVLNSTCDLLETMTSLKPKTAQLFMKDEQLFPSLVTLLENSINTSICADCGSSVTNNRTIAILRIIQNCLPYYTKSSPEIEGRLTNSLVKLSSRVATYSEHSNGVFTSTDGLQDDIIHSEKDVLVHDPTWHELAAQELLTLWYDASFLKNEHLQEMISVPIMKSLHRTYASNVFLGEDQNVRFAVTFIENWKNLTNKGRDTILLADIFLQDTAETLLASSLFLRSDFLRKYITRGYLYLNDYITQALTATAFGYIWGVLRTLVTLRHVSPPAEFTNTRSWRIHMARNFGFRAGIGAFLWTALLVSDSIISKHIWVRSDMLNKVILGVETGISVGVVAYFFYLFPFFFFPALASAFIAASDSTGVKDFEIFVNTTPKIGKKRDDGEWT